MLSNDEPATLPLQTHLSSRCCNSCICTASCLRCLLGKFELFAKLSVGCLHLPHQPLHSGTLRAQPLQFCFSSCRLTHSLLAFGNLLRAAELRGSMTTAFHNLCVTRVAHHGPMNRHSATPTSLPLSEPLQTAPGYSQPCIWWWGLTTRSTSQVQS